MIAPLKAPHNNIFADQKHTGPEIQILRVSSEPADVLRSAWHGAHETGRAQGVSPESSAARDGSFINARAKGHRGEIFSLA